MIGDASDLTGLRGKSERELVDWWTRRLDRVARAESEEARARALAPYLRELTTIASDERRRLTRARILAFAALPDGDREVVGAARRRAWDVDRDALEADQEMVEELLPVMDANVRAVYPQRPA